MIIYNNFSQGQGPCHKDRDSSFLNLGLAFLCRPLPVTHRSPKIFLWLVPDAQSLCVTSFKQNYYQKTVNFCKMKIKIIPMCYFHFFFSLSCLFLFYSSRIFCVAALMVPFYAAALKSFQNDFCRHAALRIFCISVFDFDSHGMSNPGKNRNFDKKV